MSHSLTTSCFAGDDSASARGLAGGWEKSSPRRPAIGTHGPEGSSGAVPEFAGEVSRREASVEAVSARTDCGTADEQAGVNPLGHCSPRSSNEFPSRRSSFAQDSHMHPEVWQKHVIDHLRRSNGGESNSAFSPNSSTSSQINLKAHRHQAGQTLPQTDQQSIASSIAASSADPRWAHEPHIFYAADEGIGVENAEQQPHSMAQEPGSPASEGSAKGSSLGASHARLDMADEDDGCRPISKGLQNGRPPSRVTQTR